MRIAFVPAAKQRPVTMTDSVKLLRIDPIEMAHRPRQSLPSGSTAGEMVVVIHQAIATVLEVKQVWRNNFRPTSFVFDHRIENSEQFVHVQATRRNFGSLAFISRAVCEVADHGITSAGHQGCHIEHGPYGSTSTPDTSPTSEGPAVAIGRGAMPTKPRFVCG